jgi:hypothetical protein
MRNFDFSNLQSCAQPDELPPSGLQNLFSGFSPEINSAVQVEFAKNGHDKIAPRQFLPLNFQLFQIKWSYRPGPVSIQSTAQDYANLRHDSISAKSEF